MIFIIIKQKSNKKININVSAIVGENGSGKSSIVELFYAFCYNISVINEILFDETESILLNKNDIVKDIKVEVFYQFNENVFLINLNDAEINLYRLYNDTFKPINEKLSLNDFFYTISINYSLHSLNSNILGDWVKRIFHKNDGYQTPIVLNPYRDKGNIEINNEEHRIEEYFHR